MSKFQFLLLGTVVTCMSACIDENNKSDVGVSKVSTPSTTLPTVKAPSEFSPHAAQLADAVQQSQARLASRRSDICPKLIEFTVDDTTQVRQNEIMRSQSCKYFIYPQKGDKIKAVINNKNMKAELVQPKYFNFVNGLFVVEKPGKHVLQISYKSHHGDRAAQKYSLVVTNQ